MNNKELIAALASRLDKTQKQAEELLNASVAFMKDEFSKGNSISFQGFGALEVQKKEERIVVNPSTKKRMLVPPKLTLAFKLSPTFKEKLNPSGK